MSCNGSHWIGLEVRQARAELASLFRDMRQIMDVGPTGDPGSGPSAYRLASRPLILHDCYDSDSCAALRHECKGSEKGSFKCYQGGEYNNCTNGKCFPLGLPGCGECCAEPGSGFNC
jgi:hypothetical protein